MTGDVHDHQTLLDYIIAHGRLRERVARKFAHQIGSALAYCHHHNIVHRDITVDNILISPTGDAKITNFNFATTYNPFGHLYTFCGTSYFPAPEMCAQKPYVGPEVDVWGLGVVLYILVCGRSPFDAHDIKTIHAKIMRGSAEYPFHLSGKCENLLSRMLTPNPTLRVSLSEVLSHPWMVCGFSGPPETPILLCTVETTGFPTWNSNQHDRLRHSRSHHDHVKFRELGSYLWQRISRLVNPW
ncbi:kinase-like domain-containing protein [Mycena epipterygia]|nr:kinase-like domain-containing protein [Mycena epipterygia]